MKDKKIGYRPTWAEINLDNLAYNFKQIKRRLKQGVKVMACVKADAYGHGIIPVTKRLVSCGADYFGVASIDEGIRLRKAGIVFPVLVLGMVLKEDINPLFRYKLTPAVCSEGLVRALHNKARLLGKIIDVHIKVDTGMGRLGVLCNYAPAFIKMVHKLKSVNIKGVFTHLACADINRDFTLYQIDLFNRLVSKLNEAGIYIPLLHAANSIGIIDYRESHFNMVRPGLLMYGLYPKEGLDIKLKPVLSLKTKVVYIKRLPKGSGVSYGHTYITGKDAVIATVPIGYGDGYPRNLSNAAAVLIRGRRFNISGRVCMDQIMIDAGNARVKVGDEVVLVGSQGTNKITAEELAVLSGTIPYEIVCGLGSRVPRIYVT